jgi:putative ABC transport system permease protein
MDGLVQDIRYALRSLSKSPGFVGIALATIALGVGVNSAIFTIVNAVVLRPLPYPHADRLVRVTADIAGNSPDIGMSPPELFDYRDRADLFDDIAGIWPIDANVTEIDQPERVEVLLASPSYFSVLGAHAALGRVFAPDDYVPGIAEVAVLSDAMWKRRFGGAPDVVGRKLRIDGDWYTVVGVMPPGFRHPGRSLRTDIELWVPVGFVDKPFGRPVRGAYFITGAIARLKPGITIAEARQRLDAFGRRIKAEFPGDYSPRANWTPRLVPLGKDVVGQTGSLLLVLLGAVGLVLLIACTNVAGLLLARAASRQRELAVRRALGSGRGRLARLLLAESLTLSLAGGAFGLLLAIWGLDLLIALVPDRLPRITEVRIDGAVVAFTFAIAVATGILFGLAPALQFSNPDVLASLKDGRSPASNARRRLRAVLVACEFALAVVLLVGATLLVRSFWRLQQVNTGVDADRVLTARLWLPQPNDPSLGKYAKHEARLALFENIMQRLHGLPGVTGVAAVQSLPLDGGRGGTTITIDGRETPDAASQFPAVAVNLASQEYFELMGIPISGGRGFKAEDSATSTPVIVVSRELVRQYFPDRDPIGQRIHFGGPRSTSPWMTIVGVAGDVLGDRLDAPPRATIYRPLTQASSLSMGLAIKSSGDLSRLEQVMGPTVREADPDLPVYAVRTMKAIEAAASASRRFSMRMLGGFALLALTLAAIGIYGVMAHLVSQRTREIGIRMALGARPAAVVAMVVTQAVKLAGAGVVLGLIAAFIVTEFMAGMLFQISPTDPWTFVGIGVLMTITALVAAATPARRAARVDPIVALRTE